ncbi:hypothetical protein KIW84_020652 [Lathyrus oleraceus]|uniref:Replication factor A C-terminal domain-containing protein n=1 Tax=Pisum sativum TaxID=3888 RepID=A0A9D4Y634_PEA|nr:hypothetical protein KIW84_020652 [Pisum sativum]
MKAIELQNIPPKGYFFKDFGEILQGKCKTDRLEDIIGAVSEINHIQSNTPGKKVVVSVVLKDLKGNCINCNLWEIYGSKFLAYYNDPKNNGAIVILLTHAMVKDGQVSNAWSGSKLLINEDIPEIQDFMSKLPTNEQKEKPTQSAKSLSNWSGGSQYSPVERFVHNAKCMSLSQFCKIKHETLCVTVATTLKFAVSKYGWFYYGCTRCSSKAPNPEKAYECSCGQKVEQPIPRYKIEIYVSNGESKYRFVFWDSKCAAILGMTAEFMHNSMVENGEDDPMVYPDELEMLGNCINCNLWEIYGSKFLAYYNDPKNNGAIVILLTHAMVKDGQVSNAWSGSKLLINEDIPEIQDFMSKLPTNEQKEKPTQSAKSLSNWSGDSQYSPVERFVHNAKCMSLSQFCKIKHETLCVTVATTLKFAVSKYGWFYYGCTRCSSKAPNPEKAYECSCGQKVEQPIPRYKIEIYVSNGESKYRFVFWDSKCAAILGMTAEFMHNSMVENGEDDPMVYPDELEMLDNCINCNLWEIYGSKFLAYYNDPKNNGAIVILLTHAMVKDGQVSNAWSGSKLLINEDIPEIQDFMSKLPTNEQKEKPTQSTKSLSNWSGGSQYSSVERFVHNAKCMSLSQFCKIKHETLCVTVATTLKFAVSKYGWFYYGCTRCSSKAPNPEKAYECSCGQKVEQPIPRYKIEIYVSNGESKYRFVFWDSKCAAILGMTAEFMHNSMVENGEDDPMVYPDELEMLLNN